MNPWRLAAAEWRTQHGTFWGVALLLALALAFALSVNLVERGLRQASSQTATRFDLLVGVAGSPTQLVLSALYLQPQALALLPPPVWDALQADPGVAQLIPLANGDAVGPYPVIGTSAALVSGGRYFQLAQGRRFAADDEAVIGASVELALDDTIQLSHGAPQQHAVPDALNDDVHAHPVRVVGRLAPTGSPWDRAVLVPVGLLWSLHAHPPAFAPEWLPQPPLRQVPILLVQPRSVADAYRLRQQWRRGGLMAVFPAEVLAELFGTLGDARQVLALVAAGTQLLVLGAGLLTVTVLLATRRHAYAALRALGAPRAYLFALGWLLAMGVGLRACLVAVPLAAAMGWAAQALLRAATGLSVSLTPQWSDLALPGSLLLACAIGATLLAARACTRPVLDDLRG
ncbi:MAG: FtsX-like permease family protein [Leptothrix sp. (in: b-proteobacteria)]